MSLIIWSSKCRNHEICSHGEQTERDKIGSFRRVSSALIWDEGMIDFGTITNVRLKKTECSKPRGKTQVATSTFPLRRQRHLTTIRRNLVSSISSFLEGAFPAKGMHRSFFIRTVRRAPSPTCAIRTGTASRLDQKVGKPDEITESQLLFHHVAD
jgi:hypothetical protein